MVHRYAGAAFGVVLMLAAAAQARATGVQASGKGPETDIAVSLTDNRATIVAGQNLTYVLRVSNQGEIAANGVAVVDDFPDNCVPSTWTCSGVGGAVCPANGSGDVSLSADIPPGTFVNVLATCRVPADAPIGTVTNSASATLPAGIGDPDPVNNTATDTTGIVGTALLSGINTVAGDLAPGGTVTYTVVITNSGSGNQNDNPGEEFFDFVDPQLVLKSASATSGTATTDVANGFVQWNGALAAGASVTVTLTATIRPDATGTILNIGIISYDNDANGSNNAQTQTDDPAVPGAQDPTTFVVSLPTAITLSKSVFPSANYMQNSTVYYTIIMANSGDGRPDNPGDEFVDVLPEGVTPIAVQPSSGSATFDAATRTVRWNGAFPSGRQISMTIYGHIEADTAGTKVNQATLRYDADGDGNNETTVLSDDPSLPGATDPTSFTVLVPPTLLVGTKAIFGDYHYPGDRVQYTFTLSNYGGYDQADSPGDELSDVLPAGITFEDMGASSGTMAYDPATRRLSWNGPVPRYGGVGMWMRVRVNADASGTIYNQAVVRYDADSNGSNESSAVTDDPLQFGDNQPTGLNVIAAVPGPGPYALLLLGLGLLLLARPALRRVPAPAARRRA